MRGILTYHAVDRSGSVISLTPEVFAAHVAWLASGAVRVVGVNELLTLDDDSDAVALTFDDALASVASEAAPRLADYGLAATVFVVTDHVGRDNRWGGAPGGVVPVQSVLPWDALGRLMEAGWTVGSHSRRHPHLTHCSDSEIEDELASSCATIAHRLGVRPTVFAYPFGACNARVGTAVAAHYPLAVTTRHRLLSRDVAPHLLPRLDAWYFRGKDPFRNWGTARFSRAVAGRDAMRRLRRAWR